MKKGTIVTTALVLTALLALIVVLPKLQLAKDSIVAGSVASGNEYSATTTRHFTGTQSISAFTALKVGPGTLGSLIITGAGAGYIEFYDGTSTAANTEWTNKLIATVPVSAAAGTYTFDVATTKGIAVNIVGTAPTSTITFR